ncbi:hypothetical protein P154DRAFT_326572 [Amniculicola lignicola CBS 123094]|uniref:Uncharacterized protein n=1 Tax=Amniculicola lignicola CBS 123094 TaxID=1392246 RepID=A0A6A5W4X3_9PLEO|nr:hypothetical protein P154DRAFT_326572 [Amniculicola lignicola CBS 123094]
MFTACDSIPIEFHSLLHPHCEDWHQDMLSFMPVRFLVLVVRFLHVRASGYDGLDGLKDLVARGSQPSYDPLGVYQGKSGPGSASLSDETIKGTIYHQSHSSGTSRTSILLSNSMPRSPKALSALIVALTELFTSTSQHSHSDTYAIATIELAPSYVNPITYPISQSCSNSITTATTSSISSKDPNDLEQHSQYDQVPNTDYGNITCTHNKHDNGTIVAPCTVATGKSQNGSSSLNFEFYSTTQGEDISDPFNSAPHGTGCKFLGVVVIGYITWLIVML